MTSTTELGATVTSPQKSPDLARSDDTLPFVRQTVRALLMSSPAYLSLNESRRRGLAKAMVRVCQMAAELIREEMESDADVRRQQAAYPNSEFELQPRTTPSDPRTHSPTLAAAQSAGAEFSGVSAEKIADTTQRVLNAVSFPRFVGDLINGVFKAMLDSTAQQMNMYVELLNNVAASIDGFEYTNFDDDGARSWLAEKFPGAIEFATSGEGGDDNRGQRQLKLREGASMPSSAALRTTLGLGDTDPIPSGNPEQLVALARRQLAVQRQQMLSTMVQLGMQRIVIDSGRISASMRFHIDTRSAARDDRASRFDFKNESKAQGSVSVGVWGVSASMTNTIGYVSTQRTQTAEEMNTDLDLNSSVEINFRSDYLPLNRMTTPSQADRIRSNSINPEAEAAKERLDRLRLQTGQEAERGSGLDQPAAINRASSSVGPPAGTTQQTTSADSQGAIRSQAPASRSPVNSNSGTADRAARETGGVSGAGSSPSQNPRQPAPPQAARQGT